jgi:5-methylcytosine-specific restriction endonuclease McrA
MENVNGANCDFGMRSAAKMHEVDHITPTSQGGRRTISNLQILHGHCHDKKSASDLLKLRTKLN